MEILPATLEQASQIASLVNAAYEVERFFVDGDRTSRQEIETLLHTGTVLIGREPGGQIVACVHVEVDGHQARFGLLAVAPTRQRQALGQRLVHAAEGWARAAGATTMTISVVNLRTDLLAYYLGLGYAPSGEAPYVRHRPVRQACHFVLMEKSLDSVLP
jgi:GNAT superfamily N-acetyltransferase